MVGRAIEDFLTPESPRWCRPSGGRSRSAGGWPEPDTMRIVTFPGTLVDVEVWSHPVVWGGHGWRTRCTCARSTRRWPRSPGSAWSSPGPAPRRSSWSTSTARIVAWNSARHRAVRLDRRGGDRSHSPTRCWAGRRTRPTMDEVARGLAEGGELDGRADRAHEARPRHRRAPLRPVRARLAGQPPWASSSSAHGVFTDADDGSALMVDLAAAIDDDQLVVHYQPMVRAEDSVVVKVEALVRWQHPELGLLPPLAVHPAGRGHAAHAEHQPQGARGRVRARWRSGGPTCCPRSSSR